MNMPQFKEMELIDDGRKNFHDGEWVFLLWGKFEISNEVFEISGFKPYFISFGKRGKITMGAKGHDLAIELMGSKGF